MSHTSDHCHNDSIGRRRRSTNYNQRRRRRHSYQRARRNHHVFDHEKALIFGVVQTLTGFITLILAIVSVAPEIWGLRFGAGFWSCLCFLIAGFSGIVCSRKKSNINIIIYMVFSTLSVICALILLTLSAIGIAAKDMIVHDFDHNNGAGIIAHCLIIVVAIVESACGTAAGIIGCSAVCTVWYGFTPSSFYELPSAILSQRYTPRPNTCHQPQNTRSRLIPISCTNDRLPDPVVVPGSPLDPPQYPNVAAQQFAIVAPGVITTTQSDTENNREPVLYTSANAFAIQTVHQGNHINQLMYIMPASHPVPQPGENSLNDTGRHTPPPSYSQIDLSISATSTNSAEDDHSQGHQCHRQPLLSVMDVAFHNANLTHASRERRLSRRQQDMPYSRTTSTLRRHVSRINSVCLRTDNVVRPTMVDACQNENISQANDGRSSEGILNIPHTVQNEDGTMFPVTTV